MENFTVPLCLEEEALLPRDFTACIERRRSANAEEKGAWGWKEPQHLFPCITQLPCITQPALAGA
jgi:hypothetical protein